METLQDIKHAIARLPFADRRDLISWTSALPEYGFEVREPAVACGMERDPAYMSVEEYLAFEIEQTLRHEYVNGVVYAMSGASERHNVVTLNLGARFHAHVRGGPCRAFVNDFRLRIQTDQDTIFYYPDVMVTCTREGVEDHWLRHPKLIVEVLSPSTTSIDRREKYLNYTKLASLEEYILIAQDRSEVIVHHRKTGWVPQRIVDSQASAEFCSLALTMPLAEIYEGIEW